MHVVIGGNGKQQDQGMSRMRINHECHCPMRMPSYMMFCHSIITLLYSKGFKLMEVSGENHTKIGVN